uniref:G domain-containing protein n=1 Tax=Chromera velia CCMP2878 TaxID=1169474 RepID=A0A0G4FI44_9ALVE|eukprot:Cvel_16985.t1-p1 / transcript=Cvel_16985.t1 / gene=Cvel_16985 / organism=Chromera_velia_CCMP2878 / gene_product=Protein NLRC3, putative / transcript_product=Protein NLRC3, putative / location=Cvel_scaffold1334:6432-15508(+) / protein_length=621 / sequence_SO=supercontig / SO=protein_coding / is_pseudo=false
MSPLQRWGICVHADVQKAKEAEGVDLVVLLGCSGAGKSSAVNSLAGCKMQLEAKGEDEDEVVVVAEDSMRVEVAPIGHSGKSETFFPEISRWEEAGDSFFFCDCPGFGDNRGAEVNTANAVNVCQTLRRSSSVRLLVLLESSAVGTAKGAAARPSASTMEQFFGGPENVEKHKESIAFAITKLGPKQTKERVRNALINRLREAQGKQPGEALSSLGSVVNRDENFCVLDPLETVEGHLPRDRCQLLLCSLTPMSKQEKDSEKGCKQRLTSSSGQTVRKHSIQRLMRLECVEHPVILKLIDEAIGVAEHWAQTRVTLALQLSTADPAEGRKVFEELRDALKTFREVQSDRQEVHERLSFTWVDEMEGHVETAREKEAEVKRLQEELASTREELQQLEELRADLKTQAEKIKKEREEFEKDRQKKAALEEKLGSLVIQLKEASGGKRDFLEMFKEWMRPNDFDVDVDAHSPRGKSEPGRELDGNSISAEGAKAIAQALQSGKVPKLSALGLAGNSIGDKGVKAIAQAPQSGKVPKLSVLWLGDNSIGAEGAKAVAEALQSGKVPSVTKLGLSDNRIGAEGARAISQTLQADKVPNLSKLGLFNNNIGTEGKKLLKAVFPGVEC